MKKLYYIAVIMLLIVSSCKEDKFTFGDLNTPTIEEPVVLITGQTTEDPNGDGSGQVSVQVKATNAINYKVDFGDGSAAKVSTSQKFTHKYGHTGLGSFEITVIAYGSAGISSSRTVEVDVIRNFEPNPELVEFLTGNSSKTWVIDSLSAAHLGVGPAEGTSPEWWAAPPLDKKGLGIYDDEYIFHADGKFEHITNESLFGKQGYLADFQPGLSGDDDFTLIGPAAANYTDQFSYDGSDEEEFIVFAGLGHLGNYMGSHRFQVLERTATSMTLRTIGKDTNAWYVKIKTKGE